MKLTLVLLAAGMSTRYGRLKQLEPVGPEGEALLDYAVFDAYRAGFSRVVLIIRRELEEAFQSHITHKWPPDLDVVFHHQIMDDLPGAPAELMGSPAFKTLLRKREKPWGTAHALLTARPHLPGPFVLLNADDFYGAAAYVQAAEFLRDREVIPQISPTFGLVTYTLGDTLSAHGGVSRGVCQVDDGEYLTGIREVLEIVAIEEGLSGETVSGQGVNLSGSEPVSTNFWLLDPRVFPFLETGLKDFLGTQPSAQPEFLIPTVMNEAVGEGRMRVKGIPTLGRFLGITHPADRTRVVEALEAMTEAGDYPRPLWG